MSGRIILLTSLNSFLMLVIITKGYLWQHYNLESTIILVPLILDDKIYENDIVIPFDIEAQKTCFKFKFKKCLVNNPDIYELLDNKSKSFLFCKQLNIPQIPTFVNNNYSPKSLHNFINHNKSSNYIVKHQNGLGSLNIYTLDKEELIDRYNQTPNKLKEYIIQPYLDIDIIITIDCLCYKGKILEYIIEIKRPFYKKDNLIKFNINNSRIIHNKNTKLHRTLKREANKVINKLNYNGFIELEFIINNNKLLLMEINPRICFLLISFEDDKSIYIERLIKGYINLFQDKKYNKITKFGDNSNAVGIKIYILGFIALSILLLLTIIIVFYVRK